MNFIDIIKNCCHKKDELIGIWTREDDGSGFLSLFGWSLKFNENSTGKYYSWCSLENINEEFDFEWYRTGNKSIGIRRKEENWENLEYVISKQIGSYGTRYYKLVEKDKEKFYFSSEPLFKMRK